MSVLLTSAIEWVAATSLGRVAHAKAGIGVNFIVSNVQRLCLEFLRKSSEMPPSQGVSTTSVSHSSLAWHNNDDDNGDDDDEKNDDGNVIVDHDDLAGDHDVLGEVTTARISELLLLVLAPVAHLV